MKLIGLSGTNGSGKDTIGHMLAEQYNYLFISVTELLRAEAVRRGLEPRREVLRTISAEWRRESGLGVLVAKAIETFEASDKKYVGLVVASLRNPGEVDTVHEHGGIVIWVDADPHVRYARISRGGRGRDAEDNKTFEEFLAEQEAEMQPSGDEATLNMSGVKEKSDLTLENDGEDIEEFKVNSAKKLRTIGYLE
jgi:dephospho-CoA kinase